MAWRPKHSPQAGHYWHLWTLTTKFTGLNNWSVEDTRHLCFMMCKLSLFLSILLLIPQGYLTPLSVFILFLWCPYWFCSSFSLMPYLLFYWSPSPRYERSLLLPIPKPNRELLLTPYPLKLLSFLCSLSYSGCNCPHGASISSALISSSALPSMVVATSPDQSCSFYDVQPSPHTIPLPPLTSEQSSRHIYVFKHSTETIFYAGYFNPIHPQTGDTNSELSPELLSLDNFVCTYGIQFTSLSDYHPCFHPPNLFTATVHVFQKSLFSAFLTF